MAVAEPAARIAFTGRRPVGPAAGRLVRSGHLNISQPGSSRNRISTEDWRLLGTSLTGRAHEERGTGNQDALAAATAADGSLLLAVADGAGSAPESATGARLATETALAAIAAGSFENLETALLTGLHSAARAVAAGARRAGNSPRDYACTLLLAIVTDSEVAALQLGDGAIVASIDSRVQRLTRPWQSDYAGETVFLTSPGAGKLATVAVQPAEHVSGLALLTDGLEPVAMDLASGEPFAPFFEPLFSFTSRSQVDLHNTQLAALLGSERVRSRTHDDTTLLIAALEAGR